VTFPRPAVDVRRPPAEFDDLIDWFELVSYNLVLLAEYDLEEIRRAIEVVEREIVRHCTEAGESRDLLRASSTELRVLADVLDSDHRWFATSLEQLDWFFRLVERDDHGGNRQALGQYGRAFAESMRRHRSDERDLIRRSSAEEPARSRVAASKGN
jgi:hypothetical protein